MCNEVESTGYRGPKHDGSVFNIPAAHSLMTPSLTTDLMPYGCMQYHYTAGFGIRREVSLFPTRSLTKVLLLATFRLQCCSLHQGMAIQYKNTAKSQRNY